MTFRNAQKVFEVRPSSIADAGEGLWAVCDIPKDSIFSIQHTRPRLSANCAKAGYDVLEYFYDEQSEGDTPCLSNGKLCTLDDMSVCDKARRPRYVYARREQPPMKANDLAWSPGIDVGDYTERSVRNKLELILAYTNGIVTGTYVLANQNITAGEEVGITYSHDYWS